MDFPVWTLIPFLLMLPGIPELVAHALIEYVQFIVLLLALFTVSGGIVLRGDLPATPRTNTTFIAVGGLLASFIGTTGAAMLLIRPILAANAGRRYRAHTVVFTIFVVANCGGLLTPLATRRCSWACSAACRSPGPSASSRCGCWSTPRC